MKILDATCGFKGIWYQKNHPFVTFMDKRKGTYHDIQKGSSLHHKRMYKVNPDVISGWKDAPFPNNHFDMIIFDPPHLLIEEGKSKPSMVQAYGYLDKHKWKQELKQGIDKLFDILKPEGVFILKWCENSVKVDEIIKLCPYPPMFGSNTKSKGHTANYWILFIKYNVNKTVADFTQAELKVQSLNKDFTESCDFPKSATIHNERELPTS